MTPFLSSVPRTALSGFRLQKWLINEFGPKQISAEEQAGGTPAATSPCLSLRTQGQGSAQRGWGVSLFSPCSAAKQVEKESLHPGERARGLTQAEEEKSLHTSISLLSQVWELGGVAGGDPTGTELPLTPFWLCFHS